MRALLVAVAMLLAVHSAAAADWATYENKRFGFSLDLPPQFAAVSGADQIDRRSLASADGSEQLTISGGIVQPGSFNSEWKQQQAALTDAGWALSYEPKPPNWTSFTGTRGERSLYVKMIPLCGGTKQYAMFALEYPSADEAKVEPDVLRMAGSFKHADTGFSC
jgi:hypothetical protein